MNLRVNCPGCGASYSVEEEKLGSRGRCKCGQSFTLAVSADETHVSPSTGSESEESELPKKIGQYVVQKRLGAGAMGEVYLAHDPKLERDVAIKVLPEEYSTDKERLQRFLREARSAAKLHHTNAAAVYEIGTEDKRTFIAMEYIDGAGLDETLSSTGPMPWREATRIIRDAAAGLAAAHEIGLVHRDVKPANLMRTAKGVTKVVDFGLARAQSSQTELTRAGTLLGTPAYMAPEQWVAGDIDGRSDLYSLTATFYALLAGRPPFVGADVPALGYLHRYEPLPDPREHVPDLPDGVCRILARGSSKQPEERYQTAEELIADLDALLATPEESLTTSTSWHDLAGTSTGREATVQQQIPQTTEPAEEKPAEEKPAEENPAEENPAEENPAEVDDVPDSPTEPVEKAAERTTVSPTAEISEKVASVVAPVTQWFRERGGGPRKRLVWISGAGGLAILLLVLISLSGNHGTAEISIFLPPDETPKGGPGVTRTWGLEDVEVRLDGEIVDLGKDPPNHFEFDRTLSVGEHELALRGDYIDRVSRTFTIRRGETTVVKVYLKIDYSQSDYPESGIDYPDPSEIDNGLNPPDGPDPVAPGVDESLKTPPANQ